MNPRPVDVKPLNDYELLVTFQNGEKKVFDAKPILSLPLYQPLKNKGFFCSLVYSIFTANVYSPERCKYLRCGPLTA